MMGPVFDGKQKMFAFIELKLKENISLVTLDLIGERFMHEISCLYLIY